MTWVWFTLLVVGLALLGYTAVRVLLGGVADIADSASPLPPSPRSRALEILDERYAAGELSTQDYEERRAVLAGGRDGS